MNRCLVLIVIFQEDMTLRQSWLRLIIRVFQGRLTTVDAADWRSRIEAAQQNQGLLLSTNGEEWLMLLRSRSSTQGFLLHSGLMLGQLGREKAIWIQILTQSCMQALMTSPYRVRESA